MEERMSRGESGYLIRRKERANTVYRCYASYEPVKVDVAELPPDIRQSIKKLLENTLRKKFGIRKIHRLRAHISVIELVGRDEGDIRPRRSRMKTKEEIDREVRGIARKMKAKLGRTLTVSECCRGIRIAPPRAVGEVCSGYNETRRRIERVICTWVEADYNKTLVRELVRMPRRERG